MSKIAIASLTATALLAAACSGPVDGPATAEAELANRKAAAGPGTLASVSYDGDGCDGGSATTGLSPDSQAFTSAFSKFLAVLSGNPADAARACLLHVRVNVPSGWSYNLDAVDFRGFAALTPAVTTGHRQATYLVGGVLPHATAPVTFVGGDAAGDYAQRDVDAGTLGWSPCGGGQDLWIGVRLGLEGAVPTASAILNIDSIDGELSWKQCR